MGRGLFVSYTFMQEYQEFQEQNFMSKDAIIIKYIITNITNDHMYNIYYDGCNFPGDS